MSKTILITGAGRRLGKTLAEYWLTQGWQVIAHFNTVCELELRPNLRTVQANLADQKDVASLCQELALAGPVDAVIHNASCFIPDCAATDLGKHYEVHFNVHVKAPAMITEALQWAPEAAMVAITDIYADIPNERFAAYCASKAGLQNWALSMAQRLAGKVRVNVIQPGPIQFLPEHDEAYRTMVLSQSLIRRELGYDAIVEACHYLLSAKALTGTQMRVDGGRFVANRYDQTFRV